ncbi:hypothetical protein AVEN_237361-1 [Araneus ventricosus]|uniref:Uncharacterized protein n=1 Tax=Araneus ventricosus TaxID=182803 RepID=A0A4Y2ULW8_ARAVE|nr:hypothetical protein AVEN_237361-1 [Araneus ventricosus]
MPKSGRGYYDWRNPREAVVNGKLGTFAPNGTFYEYEEEYQTPNPRRYPQRHKNQKLDNECPGDTTNDWTYLNIPENSPPIQKDPTIVKINSPVAGRINKIPPLDPDLERAIAAIISKSPRKNKLPVGEPSNTLESPKYKPEVQGSLMSSTNPTAPTELSIQEAEAKSNPTKTSPVLSRPSSRTPSPIHISSSLSLESSRGNTPIPVPSINISIPEKISSPTQRAPPYLNTETSEIEEALAEWSPQPQQETQQDELENLFSKIQNPQAYLSINISPLPFGNQTGQNTDEIPNKD